MPWLAIAAIGSSLIGSSAASSAADTQAQAANTASANQMSMFNTINNQNAPWRQAGTNAISGLQSYMGLPTSTQTFDQSGYDKAMAAYNANPGQAQQNTIWGTKVGFGGDTPIKGTAPNRNDFYTTQTTPGDPNAPGMHQFNASDLNANLAPNYDFQLQQGLGAVKNFENSTGGLIGGNALKGINDYAQNYAQGAYQQAFQNYTANQTNIFNRLSNIAGLGQTANQTSANAGTALSQAASNYATSGAAASAAGQVGSANAISQGLMNAGNLSWLNGQNSGLGSYGSGGGSTPLWGTGSGTGP